MTRTATQMIIGQFRRTAILTLLVFLLVHEAPARDDLNLQVSARVGARQFNFVAWTLDTLGRKVAQETSAEQDYLTADRRKQIVLDYFKLLDRSLQLDDKINRIFADPAQHDPAAASAASKQELSGVRARMAELQPLAESILQEQIGVVLADEGFAVGGQIVPPVSFHITALPGLLVVSPRDHIEMKAYANIEPGLTADGQAALEDRIAHDLDVSTLIAPLGGLGTYPTMIYETSDLNYVAEVGAHEWTHNFLTLRPLGINFDSSPETRTMNETTAVLVGRDIGQKVIARYYPERAPPPAAPTPRPTPGPTPTPDPEAFDFNRQMHDTRVKVDELLAAGKIAEAEAYMEARRQVFVAQGHQIRKLNQAYFAFYGAYNVGPGAGGQDPVGPAVRQMRQRSRSIKEFLDRMSWLASYTDLQKAIGK